MIKNRNDLAEELTAHEEMRATTLAGLSGLFVKSPSQ
jgi:hypothetical protein